MVDKRQTIGQGIGCDHSVPLSSQDTLVGGDQVHLVIDDEDRRRAVGHARHTRVVLQQVRHERRTCDSHNLRHIGLRLESKNMWHGGPKWGARTQVYRVLLLLDGKG